MKKCTKCNLIKTYIKFRKQSITKDGYKYQCIECDNIYARQRYHTKREYILEKQKRWNKENKEYINQYKKITDKKPINKIKRNLRKRIKELIRYPATTSQKIGCSGAFLKIYLESKFQPGMSWDNYGFGNDKWHIDHIRPLSSFNLADEKEIQKANHYSNLQPLWQKDNLSKGSKYNKLK